MIDNLAQSQAESTSRKKAGRIQHCDVFYVQVIVWPSRLRLRLNCPHEAISSIYALNRIISGGHLLTFIYVTYGGHGLGPFHRFRGRRDLEKRF